MSVVVMAMVDMRLHYPFSVRNERARVNPYVGRNGTVLLILSIGIFHKPQALSQGLQVPR
jgi:membrane-bound metal-dependent hydrolase YbcI (DUF457 family)